MYVCALYKVLYKSVISHFGAFRTLRYNSLSLLLGAVLCPRAESNRSLRVPTFAT